MHKIKDNTNTKEIKENKIDFERKNNCNLRQDLTKTGFQMHIMTRFQ